MILSYRHEMNTDRTPSPHSKNTSKVVARVKAVSPWAIVVGIAVIAATFGAPLWGILVLLIAVVVTGVKAAITERVQEVFKRKPDLVLLTSAGGEHSDVVPSPVLRPWPIDVDRIVAHQLETARESEQLGDSLLSRLPGLTDPFSVPPSQQQKDSALEKFRGQLDEFESELREWLSAYITAADLRARTFELDFQVMSAPSGAHAEAVSLVIEVPPDVEIVDSWPTVEPPPKTPVYSPPRPQSISALARRPMAGAGSYGSSIISRAAKPLAFGPPGPPPIWSISKDGHQIEAELGDVHHGRTRELDDTLMLRAARSGEFELRWTMYVKNSRKHSSGSITLVVPEAPPRPAFGTLAALERYPDVPFVDEDDDEVKVVARTEDPPTQRPPLSTGNELTARLNEVVALHDWQMLGFESADEDSDGRDPDDDQAIAS